MSLIELQRAFYAQITGDDDAPVSSTGMAIYRNAYRARLLDTLEYSFERTRRWVGEDAFTQAAGHYILSHPSASWTLDDFGADFPEVLDDLFVENPEAGELAWLEWHMQQAFAAPDLDELDPTELAAAGLADADWEHLRFTMAAGFASRPVMHDLEPLWMALADCDGVLPAPHRNPRVLVVWRQKLTPRFRFIDGVEADCLGMLAEGAGLGTALNAAGQDRAIETGHWLARWLGDGMFSAWIGG